MGEIGAVQFVTVMIVAFLASVISGLSGYGAGLILPLVLVPAIGAEATVPVMGISSFFTNASRVFVFWREIQLRSLAIVTGVALPTCLLGAYGYTHLTGPGASILIGLALLLLVPARRLLLRARQQLPQRWVLAGGAGFGLLDGSMPGTGIILIALLMAAGLHGTAVIGTDAAISLILAVAKTIVFQTSGSLTTGLWLLALSIGLAVMPGALLARWLVLKLPARVHTQILDGAVVVGGALLTARGLNEV